MSRINTSLVRGSSGSSASATSSSSPSAVAGVSGPDSADQPFKAVLQVAQKQAVDSKRDQQTPAQAVAARGGKGQQPAGAKADATPKTAAAVAAKTQSETEQIAEPVVADQPKPQASPRPANAPAASRGNSAPADQGVTKAKPVSQQLTLSAPAPVDEKTSDQKDHSSSAKQTSKPVKTAPDQSDSSSDPAATTAAAAAAQPVVTVVEPPVQSVAAHPADPVPTPQTVAKEAPAQSATTAPVAAAPTSKVSAAGPSRAKTANAQAATAASGAASAAAQKTDAAAPTDSLPAVSDSQLSQTTIVPVPVEPAAPAVTSVQTQAPVVSAAAPLPHPSVAPEAAFAAANHPPIVMGIHGQLLPDGGSMNIRLAPPELGDLQISVQVAGGAVAASFQTSNDQATRLLSHSLGQLRTALETAGVSVERLQVAQMPKESSRQEGNSSGKGDQSAQDKTPSDNPAGARDQQRRELLRRMWAKVSGKDDLDLVA